MVTPELIEYVKNERARGVADDALRQALQTAGGWALFDIEEALRGSSGIISAPLNPNSVQAIIAKTNIDGSPVALKPKAAIDPALQKFRKERKWIIFSVLSFIVLVYTGIAAYSDPSISDWIWIPMAILVVVYCASAYTARIVRPLGSPLKDVLILLLLIVLAAAISLLIAGGLCLATCLVIGAAGGF